MNFKEVWIPFTVTNVSSIILISICYRWPKIGKIVWGIMFILAGMFNFYTSISDPQAYLGYSRGAIGLYQKFIEGFFSANIVWIIGLISSCQILIGIFLFTKKTLFLLGTAGGIVFLLAISPLGLGSAFPATLLMAFSLVLLYLRIKKA